MQFVSTIPPKHKTGPQKYNTALAEAVKSGAGKWAVIATDMDRAPAYALASYLRTKKRDVFDPKLFEVTARETLDGDWEVYIRYIGVTAKPTVRPRRKK